jgi:hypothetical protein
MAAAAELSGEREIIFPEAGALALGAWIAPRQPWRVSRAQMVGLMTLCALAGVALVRFVPFGLPVKTALGLAFVGTVLTLSGTTLIPLISACILPVFLGTRTLLYPLTVLALTVILAAGQTLMERAGLRTPAKPEPCPPPGVRARHWAKTMAVLLALCLIPTATGLPYLVAPPLLVTFAELFFPHSPLRRNPGKVYLALVCAAALGTTARAGMIFWNLSVTLCALLAILGLLGVFRGLGMMLPPAAAAALLPLILPEQTLWRYPPLVCVGAAVLVAIPCLLYAGRDAAGTAESEEESPTS